MPFCPNCGKEVEQDAKFCPACGCEIAEPVRSTESEADKFTPEGRQRYIEELRASSEEKKPAENAGITKKKVAGIIIGCVIIVSVVLAIAIPSEPTSPPTTPPSTTQLTPTPAPTPKPTFEPVVITGTGDKTSRPFTVTTQEWTITWSYTPEDPEYAGFGFFVYPRGETRIYVGSVDTENDTGSTYTYAGPGDYYIVVITMPSTSWKVVIKPA